MAEPGADAEAVKRFGLRVWTYKMGEQVSLLVHLGDRLGMYRAMAGAGPLASDEVAQRTGLHERFVREWLLGQAAAGLVDRHADDRYELSDVQAAVLADEEASLDFAAGAFRGGFEPAVVERIAESFRTGRGLTYEEQGPAAAAGLARMTAPWSRLALLDTVLPALDGVVERLEAGCDVVDVGCGGGVTLTTIAQAHPRSRCVGYDPSPSALALARRRADELGLDNVELREATAEDLPDDARFGLVLTFDCLHDMPRPDRAASAVRAAISGDGTWLIKDIRSTGNFDRDRRNPLLPLFYGFSVASCLQSAMSEPDGLGLGTLGLHPGRAEELVRDAGFSRFTTHDFDEPANLYYEVRV